MGIRSLECLRGTHYLPTNHSIGSIIYTIRVRKQKRDVTSRSFDRSFWGGKFAELVSYIRSLTQDSKHRGHCTWLCKCGDKWDSIYEPEAFSKILKHQNCFYRKCWGCNTECLVSSISLYKKEPPLESNIVVILRHLIDNNKFRVYGNWLCREWNCQHKQKCQDKWSCRKVWEYQNKMQCDLVVKCQNGEDCRRHQCTCPKTWQRPQHAEKCQDKWTDQNNWVCKHQKECKDEQNCQHTKSKDEYKWDCQHEIKKKSVSLYKCESEWDCRHKCQSERECQHDWQCQHEWKSAEFTRKKLREYLKKTPEELADFFKQPCKKCGNKSSISSFLLYKQQPKSLNEKPDLEIVCHLVWNNLYRVFGDWECDSIFSHRWGSAYTWILLQRFIEEVPGSDFYVVETCKVNYCHGSTGIMKGFKPLTSSGGKTFPHKRDLCQKCLRFENCVQTGTYFGYQKKS
ncbi:11098_t:CDS:2 [Entrophospora sp. SA101]|nr:11098_t:CDS:2 [Entrophospora sp. SA101]